jgi:hypothetical protein
MYVCVVVVAVVGGKVAVAVAVVAVGAATVVFGEQ